jgi:hypothetical protein
MKTLQLLFILLVCVSCAGDPEGNLVTQSTDVAAGVSTTDPENIERLAAASILQPNLAPTVVPAGSLIELVGYQNGLSTVSSVPAQPTWESTGGQRFPTGSVIQAGTIVRLTQATTYATRPAQFNEVIQASTGISGATVPVIRPLLWQTIGAGTVVGQLKIIELRQISSGNVEPGSTSGSSNPPSSGSGQAAAPVQGVPPRVMRTKVNEGGTLTRPDLLTELSVTFSTDVTVSSSAMTMTNKAPGSTPLDSSSITGFNYNSATKTATWTFEDVPPGRYECKVRKVAVSARDSSFVNGQLSRLNLESDYTNEIYVAIPGDVNLDGKVDVLGDSFIQAANMDTRSGATWAQGDLNGDGKINVLGDAFILQGNMGKNVDQPETLTAAGSAAPATAADPTTAPNESPVVVRTTRDEGGTLKRPDLLSQFSVTFSAAVLVNRNALTVTNQSMGGTPLDSSSITAFSNVGQTATWTFAADMAPGRYDFNVDSRYVLSRRGLVDGINVPGGVTLDSDYSEQIYVAIPGDINLDGKVDVLGDSFILTGNKGMDSGATWADGDLNGDGKVNVLGDSFILIGNLNESVDQ